MFPVATCFLLSLYFFLLLFRIAPNYGNEFLVLSSAIYAQKGYDSIRVAKHGLLTGMMFHHFLDLFCCTLVTVSLQACCSDVASLLQWRCKLFAVVVQAFCSGSATIFAVALQQACSILQAFLFGRQHII